MKDKIIREIEKETWAQTHNQKINLFLTQEEKEILRSLKKKYTISTSTIVDIIANIYYSQDYTRQLMQIDTNMFKTTIPRTSVNLKNIYKLSRQHINNAVIIFCHKLDKDPFDKTFHEKVRNKLNHEFQDAYDPWIYYYEFCHMKQRYERENKQ